VGTNHKILVVDDDSYVRSLLEESLVQLGYQVDMAQDGQEAWEKLELSHAGYDLIILDKNMPRMDGIALLKRIKANELLKSLPVVMLTGANNPDEVVDGLAAGAYYYLIKPASLEVLAKVVGNALLEQEKKLELLNLVSKQKNKLGLLTHAEFSFRTLNEARELALLLAEISMNPELTVLGYSELLINAVEHGNLEISYEQKGELLKKGCWEEEVNKRLQMDGYRTRCVKVELKKTDVAIVVSITDDGDGFDWKKYWEFDPARAFDLHGRGIAMSKAMCFDSLEYREKGNCVVATVFI